MRLASKHDTVLDEIVSSYQRREQDSVRGQILDPSIPLHESFFLVAYVCLNEDIDPFHLARMISDNASTLEALAEDLAKDVLLGKVRDVVMDLSRRGNEFGCCLIAQVCAITRTAAHSLAAQFQFVDDHPELLGADL